MESMVIVVFVKGVRNVTLLTNVVIRFKLLELFYNNPELGKDLKKF